LSDTPLNRGGAALTQDPSIAHYLLIVSARDVDSESFSGEQTKVNPWNPTGQPGTALGAGPSLVELAGAADALELSAASIDEFDACTAC
jgi:hypothetical protein